MSYFALRSMRSLLLIVLVMSAAQACSSRAWYDGFTSSARHKCQQLSSPEYEDCMQQSDVGYDAYEKERDGLERSE